MIKRKNILIFLILFLLVVKVKAQTIVVGQHDCNDRYVSYNPPLPIHQFSRLVSFPFDLTGDGVDDYVLNSYGDAGIGGGSFWCYVTPLDSNEIAFGNIDSSFSVGCLSDWRYYNIPKSFNVNDTLSLNQDWRSMEMIFACHGYVTQWGCNYGTSGISGSDKYIGLRAIENGDTLYGWIKLKTITTWQLELEEIFCEVKNDQISLLNSIKDTTIQCGSQFQYNISLRSKSCSYLQWSKNGVEIVGATNDTLNLGTISLSDSGLYQCRIINSFDTVYINSLLNVTIPTPLVINDTTVLCGNNFVFKVYDETVGCTNYQWSKDGIDIFGATKDSLYFGSVSLSDTGNYSCRIYGSFGVVNRYSKLSVLVPETTPVYTANIILNSNSICEDSIAHFYVEQNQNNILSYQWFKDGLALNGANAPELTIDSVTIDDAGNYSCKLVIAIMKYCPDSSYSVEISTNNLTLDVIARYTPVIIQNGNHLVSNYASGNYWVVETESGFLSLSNESSINIVYDGIYGLQINNNGCLSELVTSQFYVEFTVTPNPFENEIIVTLNHENRDVSWELINDLGIIVLKGKMYSTINTINTTTIAKGHYYLKINGQVMKMIKQ